MKAIYLFAPIFFFLSFNLNGQNFCLFGGEISVISTSLGSPLAGPFQPNEEIELELTVIWNGQDCNWLHGVAPSFGNGWSPTSFDSNGIPEVILPLNFQSNAQGNPGDFNWYNEGEVIYKFYGSPDFEEGAAVPSGWYSTGTSPGINNPCGGNYQFDPNCSCGITQACNTVFAHQMVIKLITGSQTDCDNGLTDLSVHFKLFSDFETGSGVNPLCVDIPVFSQAYQMFCTTPEDLDLNPQEIEIYSDGNLEIDFTDFVAEINPEVSYQWIANPDNEISGSTTCLDDCGTILSQQLINSSIDQTKSVAYEVRAIRADGTAGPSSIFLVKVHPVISITTYYDFLQTICSGVTEVYIESSVFGGAMEDETIDYQYLWNTGSTTPFIIEYPEETTTYELTVTDQLGTTRTSSVTVEVIPTPMLSWNTEVEPTYCINQAYIFCVDPVEENTIFEWEVKDAILTQNDENNCVTILWENMVTDPFICVQYLNIEGCESNELCHGGFIILEESQCLVSNENLEFDSLNIFPNPGSDWMMIEGASLEMLKIMDSTGKLLWEKELSGRTSYQLNLRDFSNGIYYLMINQKEVRKLVVLR